MVIEFVVWLDPERNQGWGKSVNVVNEFWAGTHDWWIYSQFPKVREIDRAPVLTEKGLTNTMHDHA